MIRYNNICTAM